VSYLREEIKAGVIVVVSFLILSGFVILIGGSQVFEKFDTYSVKVMNAAGVEEGAQVKLGGVRAGRVLKVKAPTSPGEPVTIAIGITRGTVLYKGTKASIAQVGFVGDIYILLSVEKTTNERFKPGDVIPSDEQVQFTVLMARLDSISQSVDVLIKDINALFSERNKKEIENILRNTNIAIVSGTSNIDTVSTSLKVTTAKLELVLNEVEDILRTNKGDVSQVIKKSRESIEKAGEMIKAIEKTAKTADWAIDQQSQNIDTLIHNLNRTTEDLREVLHEIKNKPWSIIYKETTGKEE
jgi:phospholipid/cholesterol/gamma-HCH transport system substrate-binding protein